MVFVRSKLCQVFLLLISNVVIALIGILGYRP